MEVEITKSSLSHIFQKLICVQSTACVRNPTDFVTHMLFPKIHWKVLLKIEV